MFYYFGKYAVAHRVSWLLSLGHIPEGLLVLHKCDNRICVRPNHLFLGTYKDNTQDAIKKGRLKNPNAKLTEAQVKTVKELWAMKKFPQRIIGEVFNITQAEVSLIVYNKTWKTI